MKKSIIFSVTLLLFVFLTACGNDSTSDGKENKETVEDFTIGVIPAQTEGAMDEAMENLQATLSEKLDRNVTIDVYPDYNGVVEAMNYNKIDMAFFGPLTYVVAHEKSGAKAIITQLVDGEPYYYSYFITQIDSPWDTLEDVLKNPSEVNLAFGDINSTSGSLIPSIELKNRGVIQSDDEHSFQSVRYSGSHDATALSVQNKQVDVGAIDSAIYHQLVESGKINGEQIKIIWKSEKLFQYPWAVHRDTEETTINTLIETFKAIDDPVILDAFGASGFTEATDEDYKAIRDAAIKEGIITE
ncbi:phosphate/phosphite/phosphonate ABC transporter substrate-binding protein [Alkalihalobacillus sp. BA299]|uniref:phosphate/phosphite/phosphonate ABC transporter substrate-binding protein n=1 Tax=Alkalihalobacillus sp. BA299 TaxID=2815938 RepID=UPI001ADD1556|nr:phosphate/phosphite/phosphonate ABC transporter substrate-binding protein [Alkalihalobacillus sp. BA299]